MLFFLFATHEVFTLVSECLLVIAELFGNKLLGHGIKVNFTLELLLLNKFIFL